MDSAKYQRIQKLGAIFYQLRHQKTLSTLDRLTLELLQEMSSDYDRCLDLFEFLTKIKVGETAETKAIAAAVGIGKETAVQTLRALREGGFKFEIETSTANHYRCLDLPKSSMLLYLIQRRKK